LIKVKHPDSSGDAAGTGRAMVITPDAAAPITPADLLFGGCDIADNLLFAGKPSANVGDRMCRIISFFGMKS
jgi:hypothetical protein